MSEHRPARARPNASMRLALGACAFSFAASVHAGGVDRLRAFIEHTQSARGEFTQQVTDRFGKPGDKGEGVIEFQRPGRFRWETRKPYQQLLVGDGSKLWMFDPDLNQVTVKPMQDALGSTPAALLAGSNDVEKSFTLADAGTRDGQDWLTATPKDPDSTIQRVRMGFKRDMPATMELTDSFGQVTLIRFARFDANPKLEAEKFRFTPPKGADVVGQ